MVVVSPAHGFHSIACGTNLVVVVSGLTRVVDAPELSDGDPHAAKRRPQQMTVAQRVRIIDRRCKCCTDLAYEVARRGAYGFSLSR